MFNLSISCLLYRHVIEIEGINLKIWSYLCSSRHQAEVFLCSTWFNLWYRMQQKAGVSVFEMRTSSERVTKSDVKGHREWCTSKAISNHRLINLNHRKDIALSMLPTFHCLCYWWVPTRWHCSPSQSGYSNDPPFSTDNNPASLWATYF